MKKLTISIEDQVHDGLHAVIGQGNIGKFLEALARPFVVPESLASAYAAMTADRSREIEADQWSDSLLDVGTNAEG